MQKHTWAAVSSKIASSRDEMLAGVISFGGWALLIVSAIRIVGYLLDKPLTFDAAIADAFIQGLLIFSFFGIFFIVTGQAAQASFKTASYSREILERLVSADTSDERKV